MEATTDVKRRARKRADGEGSLRWSESKKLWIGRVMVGYRPDGKPDVREVAAKQQGECRKRLGALKLQAANGTLIDAAKGRDTVATFVTAWLESIEGTMEPSSLTRHRDNVRRHIIPLIGRVKLTDLRPEHLVSLFAALRTERPAPTLPTDDAPRARHAAKKRPTTLPPLSARSVKYVYTTIRKALAQAVEWGNVPRNVATVVKSPKVPSPEILSLSPDEVATFLDAVTEAGDRLAPLYTVAVLSGCRLGELLGLKWSDISDADVISINRTLTSTKDGEPVFSDPKTQRSRRSFRLSSDAVAALSVVRDRQSFERQALKDGYRDLGLVFATPLGTPMDGPNALKRFRASLRAAGVTHPYTFHSLRHTAATTMLAAGIDAKVVADRLGHSSPAFTLERYAHAVPALDDDAADRLQNVIRRARKQVV